MSDEDLAAIRERIRLLAEQVGGPSALAGLVGVHPTSIFGYMSGKRPLTTARLHAIAANYPCELEWLLHGEGQAPTPDPARTTRAIKAHKLQRTAIFGGLTSAVERFGPQPLLNLTVADKEIRLEAARARTMHVLNTHERNAAVEVLGESTVQDILDGKTCPSRELLCKLAQKLGVRTRWLLGLEE